MNESKTENMVSTKKRGSFDDLSLSYGDSAIRRFYKTKMLGVVLNGKLIYASRMSRVISRSNDAIRRLQHLLKGSRE